MLKTFYGNIAENADGTSNEPSSAEMMCKLSFFPDAEVVPSMVALSFKQYCTNQWLRMAQLHQVLPQLCWCWSKDGSPAGAHSMKLCTFQVTTFSTLITLQLHS